MTDANELPIVIIPDDSIPPNSIMVGTGGTCWINSNPIMFEDDYTEKERAALAVVPHNDVWININEQGRIEEFVVGDIDDNIAFSTIPTIPREIGNFTLLKALAIANLPMLRELPPEIGNLVNVNFLEIVGCPNLMTVPPEIGKLSKLELLGISEGCKGLTSLPPEIGQLGKLKKLDLSGNGRAVRLRLPLEMNNLSSLETLRLGEKVDIFEFLEQGGMSGWTCIKELALREDSTRSDEEYLRALSTLPNWLKELRLEDNNGRMSILALRAQLPTRLSSLFLSRAALMSKKEKDKRALADQLRRNAYLRDVNLYDWGLHSPLAEHYMDINEGGRCLMEAGRTIPLSRWPIVLERANMGLSDELPRRANVLYHLLHGPAFAGRHYDGSGE